MNCHLETLAEPQRSLWDLFANGDFSQFVLYGGTALALRLGHRKSVDFDFFGAGEVTRELVETSFPWLRSADVDILRQEPNTYVVLAKDLQAPAAVKLSFFGGLSFGQVATPEMAPNGVLIASLEDIFATKLAALHNRVECKDYRDISELLRNGLALADGISCLRAIHPGSNPAVIARALCYFEGGNLHELGEEDRRILEDAVANLKEIPEAPETRPIGAS